MMMSKIVNIEPIAPIMTITPPITGSVFSQKMSLGEIEKCLLGRARVDEILPDKTTIQLSLLDYKKDNVAEYNNSKAKVIAEQKAEAERKAAEEAAKIEAERKAKAAAEQQRLQAERDAKEAAKVEADKKAAEEANQAKNNNQGKK